MILPAAIFRQPAAAMISRKSTMFLSGPKRSINGAYLRIIVNDF
jgi:hypothetical protein